jgi:hypothetical protein
MSTMPADTDALTCDPCGHVVADCIDASGDFMTWHTGILKPGPQTFFDQRIAVANPARFNFHAHLPSVWLRDIALYQLPVFTWFAYLRHFPFRTHKCSFLLLTSFCNRQTPNAA